MRQLGTVTVLSVLILLGLSSSSLVAQRGGRGQTQGSTSAAPKVFQPCGQRDGTSFFTLVDYPETRPLKEGEVDWEHYHKFPEVMAMMRKWAADYPDLVELVNQGPSLCGRDIVQMTITNKKTGRDTDKPAMWIDGGRHSGEVTASESVLYLMWHLLTNYGKDPEITKLLDDRVMYIKPMPNPDGSEMYRTTAQTNRSTVRPYDDDNDRLVDEDPGEDLDNDGYIRQMRKYVGEKKGNATIDPKDPTKRLMRPTGQNQGDWMTYSEGIDNDGDGRYNEDGVGGLDLHRNYPENWRPMREATNRGYTQGGAGEYPLSEPETRYNFMFLITHPNVGAVNTMDTAAWMHLRPPSTSKSEESMIPKDLALYKHFDAVGKSKTHYKDAGDVYYDYARRDPNPITGELGEPTPLFGHSPDFGYFYYGAIWYGDELWNGGRIKDYDNSGRIEPWETLKWSDEIGYGFQTWTKYLHPQLGEVEIGGFNPKWFSQNPPPKVLKEWIANEAMFNMELFKALPQVRITDAKVKALGKDRYQISASFVNESFLPTALEMAKRVKIVRPDTAMLEWPNDSGVTLAKGVRANQDLGWLESKQTKNATWDVSIPAGKPVDVTVTISSTRGGVQKRTLRLGS
jgi:hypothetical protein